MRKNQLRAAIGLSLLGLGLLARFTIDHNDIEYPYRTFYALGVLGLIGSGIFCLGSTYATIQRRYRWPKP